MFFCYDMAGNKITTAVFSNCNPSLELTMTADEFAKFANAQIDTTVSMISTATMITNALPYFGVGVLFGFLALGKTQALRFLIKRVFKPF